jgi:hypothetical protein
MALDTRTHSAAASTGERTRTDVLSRRRAFGPGGRSAFDRWQEEVRRTFEIARTALAQRTPATRQWPPV